jgi:cytochrome d ubiquinol oxidase subunit I
MAARADFETHRRDLGYGLLLKKYVADPRTADRAMIQKAAWDTVPNVPVMFWAFRIMAGIGFLQIGVFAAAFILVTMRKCDTKWILWTIAF